MTTIKVALSVTLALAMALTFATPVQAGQNAIGAFFSSTQGAGTLISGVIYGNTSNPSGNGNGVLPSLAPGPWVCGNPADCAGPTNPGGSMGEFLAPLASGGEASPDFANGNDLDLDFSN